MTDTVERHRLDHIDALRAIAVLLVMWTHYAERFRGIAGSQETLDNWQQSLNFGRIGVVIFFAISGFLIPSSLRGARGEGTRRFVWRRFWRLYPPFWASLPLCYIACWTFYGHQADFAAWVANVSMVPSAFREIPIAGQYWTLEVELYFYLLCLLLFWSGRLHRMLDLSLVCVGLCAAFAFTSAFKLIPENVPGHYKGMLYYLAIMFWGACFRKAYDAPRKMMALAFWGSGRWGTMVSHRGALGLATVVLLGLALAMFSLAVHQHDSEHIVNSISYGIGIAMFALFAISLQIHSKLLNWLGQISYSIYLLHAVPPYIVFWYCRKYGLTGAPLGLYMMVSALAAIGMAWASYHLVETPALRLARSSIFPAPAPAHR